MLGSLDEADDAVQESWLRLSCPDTSGVENLGGWLTTVVAPVCLDMLLSRTSRREDPLGAHLPEPNAIREDGIALLVVLDTLAPAERIAFVLHDMPFDEIAPIVGRSAAAARQLVRRACRRVRGVAPVPAADLVRQRAAVDAWYPKADLTFVDALAVVRRALRAAGTSRTRADGIDSPLSARDSLASLMDAASPTAWRLRSMRFV